MRFLFQKEKLGNKHRSLVQYHTMSNSSIILLIISYFFAGLMDMITEYVDEYDGIVLLRPGPTIKYFAVADHRLVEYLCNSRKVVKSKRYRLFERWLGRGIFTFTTECIFYTCL